MNTVDSRVLVVGAGPVGLVMAIQLKRAGVPVRLIDREPHAAQESRALAIHARTMEMFEGMGLAEEFLARGLRVPTVNMHMGGDHIASFHFTGLETKYPFILSLPQNETEAILGGEIEVEREVELIGFDQDEEGVTAQLKHVSGLLEETRTPWIIGCDGAHSTVRRASGMSFEGEPYEETPALADVAVEWDLPEDEFQLFASHEGLIAFFGFGGGRYRVIAFDVGEEGQEPAIEDFQRAANQRTHVPSRLYDARWMRRFRISRRSVSSFRQGRVFLAGDAAHIHSPAGGQGMNTGIQDACNLAWKLAIGTDELLNSYDAERHPVAKAVLHQTDLLTRGVTSQNPVVEYLREHLAPLVARAADHVVTENVAQLAVNYRTSPIVEDHPIPGYPLHAGDRVRPEHGHYGHTLVVLGSAEAPDWLPAEIAVERQPYAPANGFVLIRPDYYAGFRGAVERADALHRYLGRVLNFDTLPSWNAPAGSSAD